MLLLHQEHACFCCIRNMRAVAASMCVHAELEACVCHVVAALGARMHVAAAYALGACMMYVAAALGACVCVASSRLGACVYVGASL